MLETGKLQIGMGTIQLFKNVVIVPDKRQEILNQVFRPDHTLPTMTLEQWGKHLEAEEMKRNKQIEEDMREQKIEEMNGRRKPNKPSDEEDEDDDEKVKKDREWDDWKDTHERGAGNKNDHYFKRT